MLTAGRSKENKSQLWYAVIIWFICINFCWTKYFQVLCYRLLLVLIVSCLTVTASENMLYIWFLRNKMLLEEVAVLKICYF